MRTSTVITEDTNSGTRITTTVVSDHSVQVEITERDGFGEMVEYDSISMRRESLPGIIRILTSIQDTL